MTDLTDVDRAILAQIAHHGELLGGYLALLVDVPGKAIGPRLSALVRRGLVTGRPVGKQTAWDLTPQGARTAVWGDG